MVVALNELLGELLDILLDVHVKLFESVRAHGNHQLKRIVPVVVGETQVASFDEVQHLHVHFVDCHVIGRAEDGVEAVNESKDQSDEVQQVVLFEKGHYQTRWDDPIGEGFFNQLNLLSDE